MSADPKYVILIWGFFLGGLPPTGMPSNGVDFLSAVDTGGGGNYTFWRSQTLASAKQWSREDALLAAKCFREHTELDCRIHEVIGQCNFAYLGEELINEQD